MINIIKRIILKKKGASLVLTLLILSAVLAIAFGVSSLILGEVKISKNVPRSLKAYYAAETGIEKSLYDARKGAGASDVGTPPSCSDGGAVCLDDADACYSIDFTAGDPNIIKSFGCYKETRRAVEATY